MKPKDTFIKIPHPMLGKGFNPTEILLLAYLRSYQEDGKYCYETQSELAKKFGIHINTLKRTITKLVNDELIFLTQKKKGFVSFKNKKIIILVDNNNPFIKTENEKTKPTRINV